MHKYLLSDGLGTIHRNVRFFHCFFFFSKKKYASTLSSCIFLSSPPRFRSSQSLASPKGQDLFFDRRSVRRPANGPFGSVRFGSAQRTSVGSVDMWGFFIFSNNINNDNNSNSNGSNGGMLLAYMIENPPRKDTGHVLSMQAGIVLRTALQTEQITPALSPYNYDSLPCPVADMRAGGAVHSPFRRGMTTLGFFAQICSGSSCGPLFLCRTEGRLVKRASAHTCLYIG